MTIRARLNAARRALRRRALAETFAEATQLLELLSVVPGKRAKLRMIGVWLEFSRSRRRGCRPGRTHRVHWYGPGGRVSATVADISELKIIREVFVDGEYDLPGKLDPPIIVDLGSNVGISVLYFAARYPGAHVLAVEPEPSAFARLLENTAHLPAVTAVQAAVCDCDGEVTLFSGGESWAASTAPSRLRPDARIVPARTLDGLLREHALERVGLLKIDIEGGEVAVLADAGVRRAERIVFEFHQEHTERSVWDVLEGLDEHEPTHFHGDSAGHPVLVLARRPKA